MTGMVARALLMSSTSLELSIVIKATVILGLGLLATRFARQARAAVRHFILATTFGALLLLPLAVTLLPRLPISIAATPAGDISSTVSWTPVVEPLSSQVVTAPRVGLSTDRRISLIAVARILWVLGALLCLVPMTVAAWDLHGLRRRRTSWGVGDARVTALAVLSALRCPVDVSVSEDVAVPMTFGLWHPLILMPPDVHAWSDEHLHNALAHELEHIRRCDWLVMTIARACCAAYWFHPLIWVAFRDLRLESERACDDAVVGVAADPAAYAEQLVTAAARMLARGPRMTLSMVNRGDLSVRVSAVLNRCQSRGPASIASKAVIGMIASLVLIVVGGLTTSAHAQGPAAGTARTFQTAAVTPSLGPVGMPEGRVYMRPSDEYVSGGVSLGALIRSAYQVSPFEMSGGPDWIESDPFDVIAQAPQGASGEEQALMLRALLADRFKLALHTERQMRPTYALVRSPRYSELGPWLVRTTHDCRAEALLDFHDSLKVIAAQGSLCGDVRLIPHRLGATAVDMPRFAVELASVGAVDRAVRDRTGLTGTFDVMISWTPQPDNLGYVTDPPSIFVALESQLGLALEPANEPIDVLVIDRAEKPTGH